MSEQTSHEMSVEPTPTPRSTSRWMVRPVGALIAVGVLVGGYVLSSVIGDGTNDLLASDDQAAADVPVFTFPGDAALSDSAAGPTLMTSPQVLPSASTAAPAAEPTIEVQGIRKPCKFGADCIMVTFELKNFDPIPEQFVCEFSNSTYPFDLRGRTRIEEACMSGDYPDTITIVADGVRSETVSYDTIDAASG